MSKQLFDEENDQFEYGEDTDESTTSAENEIYAHLESDEGADFQFFGKFAIDDEWLSSNKDDSRNSYETYEMIKLEENLYEIFKSSGFTTKYEGNKKVPKHEMVNVYLYFLDRINNPESYTSVEKFIAIVSFMKMNFETMYRELPIIHKESILKELNNKYNVLANKKSHKLF